MSNLCSVSSCVGRRTLWQIWLSYWRPPTVNSHASSSLPSTPTRLWSCPLLVLCWESSHSQLICPSVYSQFITSDSPGGPRDHQHQAQMDGPPKSWIKPCLMAEDSRSSGMASHCQNEWDNYLFAIFIHSSLATRSRPLAVELVELPWHVKPQKKRWNSGPALEIIDPYRPVSEDQHLMVVFNTLLVFGVLLKAQKPNGTSIKPIVRTFWGYLWITGKPLYRVLYCVNGSHL